MDELNPEPLNLLDCLDRFNDFQRKSQTKTFKKGRLAGTPMSQYLGTRVNRTELSVFALDWPLLMARSELCDLRIPKRYRRLPVLQQSRVKESFRAMFEFFHAHACFLEVCAKSKIPMPFEKDRFFQVCGRP